MEFWRPSIKNRKREEPPVHILMDEYLSRQSLTVEENEELDRLIHEQSKNEKIH